ncbi:MAG: hypothetical protein AB1597_08015 [Chloroflexota bacterium]
MTRITVIVLTVAVLLVSAGCPSPPEEVTAEQLAKHAFELVKQDKYQEAITECGKAVALDPNYYWAYSVRADAYRYSGQYDLAINDYTKAIELASRPIDFEFRALAYSAKGQHDLALADCQKAVQLSPKDDAYPWIIWARVLISAGKLQAAVATYQTALQIDPTEDAAQKSLANLLAGKAEKQLDYSGSDLSIVTKDLPAWIEGAKNTLALEATGGTGKLLWTGTPPQPWKLDSHGVISGTAPLLGSDIEKVYPPFTATVIDEAGYARQAIYVIRVTKSKPALQFKPKTVSVNWNNDNKAGVIHLATVSGGTPPYRMAAPASKGLPQGMALGIDTDGITVILKGPPPSFNSAQTLQFQVYVVDSKALTASLEVELEVGPLPGPSPTPTPNPTPSPTPGATIKRHYAWSYKGANYTWDLNLPESLYQYYKARTRLATSNYSLYVTHPMDDQYINSLATKLSEVAQRKGYSLSETAQFVANFVQSLPYTKDNVSTPFDDYPRYPVETLVDNGGDCEDTSILAAAILKSMGYDVILLDLPKHVAIAIRGDTGVSGSYYTYQGGKYYYLETTGEGWGVGELPPTYRGVSAKLLPLVPVAIVHTDWKYSWRGTTGSITINVSNLGTATLTGAYVTAAFDAGNNMVWNKVKSNLFDLPPDGKTTITLNLRVPTGKYTRLIVNVVDSAREVALDKSYSGWFNT